ncbi:MAG: cupin domain-containing protein [Gammaproteobacteria bacterium]
MNTTATETADDARFSTFDGNAVADNYEIMQPITFPPGIDPEATGALLAQGADMRVVFCDPKAGLSLVRLRFAPDFKLVRHTHDVDCLYYVVAGSLRMGNRTFEAGGGFFLPAHQPYGYEAGPDGVEVLEFRGATSFDMRITETSPARWKAIADGVAANAEKWKALGFPTPA